MTNKEKIIVKEGQIKALIALKRMCCVEELTNSGRLVLNNFVRDLKIEIERLEKCQQV